MQINLSALSRTVTGLLAASLISVALVSTAVSAYPLSFASRVLGGSFVAYA